MAEEQRSRVWLWVVVGGGAFFVFVLAVFTLVYVSLRSGRNAQFGGFGDKIGIVDLEGMILTPKETVKQLRRFQDDASIKAIILHINSPGGGAAASEEIYREVRRIRETKKKPIVASIETMGASGAYYAAAGTNKIFADNASIVGSIGVIAQWFNYGDLLRWAKLKEVVLKAGEFKDTGDPARELTPAERQYLQGMIDDMHEQFIRAVADGRNMKVEDIKAIANGRVWTGQQAVAIKLVDQIGDFRAAIEDTAKAAGIKGEPSLIRAEKEKRTLLDLIFGDVTDLLPDPAKLAQKNMGFYFLWK
jgi:protease-4